MTKDEAQIALEEAQRRLADLDAARGVQQEVIAEHDRLPRLTTEQMRDLENARRALRSLDAERAEAQREVERAESAVAAAERASHAGRAVEEERRLVEHDGELLGRLRDLADRAPALLRAIRETASRWRSEMAASGRSVSEHPLLVRWVHAEHAEVERDRLLALLTVFLTERSNEQERARTDALRAHREAESRRRSALPPEEEARLRLIERRGHELHGISVFEQQRLVAEIAAEVARERAAWTVTQ